MTLREIIAKIGDEYMDAELSIRIVGANGNQAYASRFEDRPSRRDANPITGEPAYITLSGWDMSKRILEAKK